jgi:hypothetical protein
LIPVEKEVAAFAQTIVAARLATGDTSRSCTPSAIASRCPKCGLGKGDDFDKRRATVGYCEGYCAAESKGFYIFLKFECVRRLLEECGLYDRVCGSRLEPLGE